MFVKGQHVNLRRPYNHYNHGIIQESLGQSCYGVWLYNKVPSETSLYMLTHDGKRVVVDFHETDLLARWE